MKTNYLFFSAAMFLLAATTLAGNDLSTNVVRRSCCVASEVPAKPLAEKSLYQLDTVWTNDDGNAIKLGSLRGRPQIVVMFFANCQYACPLVVFQMKQLEAALPPALRTKVGFTLVSFDSKRDTPVVLKNYRAQHELSRDDWTLLNGDADGVLDLAAVLGVKFKDDAQGQFSHSNVITLLNAEGEIAYQQAGLNRDNHELIRQIEQLEAR